MWSHCDSAAAPLRDVLVQEAELGERLMRALILRRVGLLESGQSGPILIGPAGSGDMLRLENFLSRNGHPHRSAGFRHRRLRQDPARSVSRSSPSNLPIVLCPGGQLLRNPSESELARCIGLLRAIDPDMIYDTVIVGAGPAGSGRRGLCRVGRAFAPWCWTAAALAARRAPRRGSRIIWAFPPAFPAWR